jgi:hypothetical protein
MRARILLHSVVAGRKHFRRALESQNEEETGSGHRSGLPVYRRLPDKRYWTRATGQPTSQILDKWGSRPKTSVASPCSKGTCEIAKNSSGEDRIPCRRFSQVEPPQGFRQKHLNSQWFSNQWLSVVVDHKTSLSGIAVSTNLAHSSSSIGNGGAA